MTGENRLAAAPRAAGIPALALISALVLAGCGWTPLESGKEGYTIRFRVDNSTSQAISRVEFINGEYRSGEVAGQLEQGLGPGEMSDELRVSGFTIEKTSSTRRFGVKVTFTGGDSQFTPSDAGHDSKILVKVSTGPGGTVKIEFSPGSWDGKEAAYTIRFKVDNSTPHAVTMIEYINGTKANDRVLKRDYQKLDPGKRSLETEASGFTVKKTESTRVFGVKISFADGSCYFGSSEAGHNNKILVTASPGFYSWEDPVKITFSRGNWD